MGAIGTIARDSSRTSEDRGSDAEHRDRERPIRDRALSARPFNPLCGCNSLVYRK